MSGFEFIGDIQKPLSCGGKAWNLNLLKRSKINVPSGFVINKELFYEFYKHPEKKEELQEKINQYLTKLKAEKLMVRSSAIGEDGTSHSFAGQLESYISSKDIRDVTQKVFNCWKSAETQRVKVYEEQNQVKLDGVGVVIQELVEPDYAGVLFSTSHLNEEEILLEYVEGHGEKLVQGEVTPYTLRINKNSVLSAEVPFNLPLLLKNMENILKLYQGVPQDIEWVAKDNNIFIVQSRPITTLKTKVKWSNTNVNENYPEKLSPLLNSIARRSYYHYFRNLSLKLGVLSTKDSRFNESFSNIIGLWGHRMYYNMSSIHKVIELSPINGLMKKSFDDFVGYQEDKGARKKLAKIWQAVTFFLKLFVQFILLPKHVKYIENLVTVFGERQKNANTIKEFNQIHHEFLNIRFNQWVYASFSDLFAMLSHGFLGKYCSFIDKPNAVSLQNGLIQSIPNLVSNQPIFRNWEIAALIRKQGLEAWFIETEPQMIWDELKAPKYAKLNQKILEYLDDFGYRCSGELTLFLENYIENPNHFIQMLQLYLKTTHEDPKIVFEQKHFEQKEMLKNTQKKIMKSNWNLPLNILKAAFLKYLVKLACFGISCRERVRLKQALLYHHFKQNVKDIAKVYNLKEMDVYYLEYDEISRIIAGEHFDEKFYIPLIELRKKKLEASTEKPDNFYTHLEDIDKNIFEQNPVGDKSDGFKGLPACAGVIKAPVKVLDSIHELDKLEKGDILVTRQTDPGWIYAFPLISGLIVERGGMLSHGAIVAREFGIPAVVGIPDITKKLKDHQVVIVDGNQGRVIC